MAMNAMHKIKHEACGQDANKAWGKAECFILRIARAKPCFNCFKELAHERLVEACLVGNINYRSINFILGMMILDDILHKCFSE